MTDHHSHISSRAEPDSGKLASLSGQRLSVTVFYSASSGVIWSRQLQLAQGACITDAIRESGFERIFPQVDWTLAGVGIFGDRCHPETILCDGDRVEVYRPLVFDPKESRRRRALHRRQKPLKGNVRNG